MKRKAVGLLLAVITMPVLTSCGERNMIVNEAAAMEKTESSMTIEETGLIVEEAAPVVSGTEEPLTKVYGDFVIYNEAQGERVDIPLKEFYPIEGEYLLSSDIPVYYTGGKKAGYAKEGAVINVMDGNLEWLRFMNTEKKEHFTVDFLLVKVDELKNATSIDVVTTQRVDKTEPEATQSEILVSAGTQEKTPYKPSTETPAPVTSEPAVVELSATESIVEPEPVTESNKYTHEEAIAVYRSIMEANGIAWNPELKNGGSWGTGWIYLTKGQPEWAGNSAVESYQMGDSVGHSWDSYYLEVTGFDENAVYLTEWHN